MTHDTTTDDTRTDRRTTLADPETLRERDDVPVEDAERTFPREQFEGLRRRYDAIEGVVMVGVVDDGRVLLADDGEDVAPTGGDVEPGEDWAAAARRNIRELTGVEIAIERPALAEFTEFRPDDGGDESFTAVAVHFEASLADDAPAFREDPEPLADPDHDHYDADDKPDLHWYDGVPDAVHPNHADHVRLYVE